jgi:hypothetical protein
MFSTNRKRQKTTVLENEGGDDDDVDIKIEKLRHNIQLFRNALKETEEEYEELMKAKRFEFNKRAWFTLMENEWIQRGPQRVKSLATNMDIKQCKIQEFFDRKNRIPGTRQIYQFHAIFNQELEVTIRGNICFHKLGIEGQTLSTNELEDYCECMEISMQELLLIIEHIKYIFLSDKNSAPLRWSVDNASPWNKYESGLIENNLMNNSTSFEVDFNNV